MSEKYLTITESAQEYLYELLSKQDTSGMGVRVFVENPGTPTAECCMAYTSAEDAEASDKKMSLNEFDAYIDEASVRYLEDAVIDYSKDRMGGQLTFKAPKSKVPSIGENASVEERIHYFLQSEINPQLASHGGNIELMQLLEDDTVAVLQFGGGCQGCGMADVTLKDGVEKTLLERVPELKRVTDVTDHTVNENAFYK
ncbi:Fe/S biogenesis protein NfuA [Gammaproteobacteria bacterium 45_16_T64]|nr:Fe/S biogenesis protein NfuA [Gammaproteobacteria bacterium 45_16_T64]